MARGLGSLGAAQSRLDAEQLDLAVRFAETAYAWREAERQIDLHGRRLLPKAKAAFDAARAGYSSGATSFIDLQAAEREYLEHHLIHAEGLGQREMALAEMSLVILGRWPQDVPGLLPEPAAATVPEKNEPAHKK